ncbi:MAG: WD40/YVTN/BNR-like repeat-containing protein [Candidatus Eiseniibacteriota bacterium]
MRACAAIALAGLCGAGAADAQWSALGLSGRWVYRLRAGDGFLYACTDDGLYRKPRSTPDSSWALLGFPGQRLNDILPLGSQEWVVCRRLGIVPPDTISIYRTTDGGTTWTPYQNGYGASRDPEVASLRALPGQPGVWIATGAGIEKSTDAGLSWHRVAEQCVVRFVDVAPNGVLWAGGETCVFSAIMFRSADLGESWELSDLAGPGEGDNSCYGTAFDPADPSVVLVGGEGRVFRTTNGGASWHTVTSPNPFYYIFGMASRAFPPLRLYAGGAGFPMQNVVLYRSDDAGLTWREIIHDSDARHGVTGLLVESGPAADTIWVATANGVYRYVETDVAGVPPLGPRPAALRSRPNPFTAATTFAFTLAHRAHVRLDVFTVNGRRVATLADGEREGGTHLVPWEAGDLPSGLYLAVLRTGGLTSGLRVARVR